MARELVVTISENGEMEIEGFGLKPGEEVKNVAQFLTDALGYVDSVGHKHSHSESEINKVRES